MQSVPLSLYNQGQRRGTTYHFPLTVKKFWNPYILSAFQVIFSPLSNEDKAKAIEGTMKKGKKKN